MSIINTILLFRCDRLHDSVGQSCILYSGFWMDIHGWFLVWQRVGEGIRYLWAGGYLYLRQLSVCSIGCAWAGWRESRFMRQVFTAVEVVSNCCCSGDEPFVTGQVVRWAGPAHFAPGRVRHRARDQFPIRIPYIFLL